MNPILRRVPMEKDDFARTSQQKLVRVNMQAADGTTPPERDVHDMRPIL